MIYGIIKNQKLELRAQAAADTIDYLTAKFSFLSSDWEGLVKYAHFRQGDKRYSVQLVDDKVDETEHLNLTAGEWEVYLHGNEYKNGEVKKRITTNIVKFTVEPTGALDGEPFPETEPSIVEALVADIADHEERISSLEESGGVEDVRDSEGNSLVHDGIAIIPKSETALTDEQITSVCAELVDFIMAGEDILGIDSNTALAV